MKIEDLDKNCRNILSVSDYYICYSVTQKRNLLRLIDTITGAKVILRGHESSICDLKISPNDYGTFCSVDNGDGNQASHVIVWKRGNAEKSLDFASEVELKVNATMVVPHPTQSNIWAISDKKHVAVFSTTFIQQKNLTITSYDQCSLHIHLASDEQLTNMVFSQDGSSLIAVINGGEDNAYVQVYKIRGITSTTPTIIGNETFQTVFHQYHHQLRIESLLAVESLVDGIVTISRNNQFLFEQQQLVYQIKYWAYDTQATTEITTTPKLLQSITLGLPQYQSRLKSPSSSLFNTALEISCLLDSQQQRYLIVSSRKSHMIACIAINPSLKSSNPQGLCFYHVALLNLKAPVISLDVTTILGREHHSAEEGEHIELSCFQEEASDNLQASIQQYHVLASALFDYQRYLQHKSSSAANSSLSSPFHQSMDPSSPVSNGNNNSNSFLDSSSLGDSSKGRSILSMLKSTPSTTSTGLPPSLSTPLAASSRDLFDTTGEKSPKPAMSTPSGLEASVLKSEVEVTPTAAVSTPMEGMKKLDSKLLFSGLKPSTLAPSLPTPVTATVTGASAEPESNGSSLDFLQKSPATTGNVNILNFFKKKPEASTAPAANELPVPLPAASVPSASSLPTPKLVEEKKVPVPAPKPATPRVEVAPVTTKTAAPVAAPAAVVANVNSADMSALMAMLSELKSEIQDLKENNHISSTSATTSSAPASGEVVAWKDELLKDFKAQQKQLLQQTTQSIKTVMEAEHKKILESINVSKQEVRILIFLFNSFASIFIFFSYFRLACSIVDYTCH